MKKIAFIVLALAMVIGLAGCSTDVHDGPATLTVVVPAATSPYGNPSTIVNITNCPAGNAVVVDGSLFSWCKGSAVTLSGYGPTWTVTANAIAANDTWTSGQAPASLSSYTGWAKMSINKEERWIGFNTGATTTFDWANSVK